jgi:hypothetical protein
LASGVPFRFDQRIIRAKTNPVLPVRIRPLNPERCSPSFQRFCKRARFASAEKALSAMQHHHHPYVIYRA